MQRFKEVNVHTTLNKVYTWTQQFKQNNKTWKCQHGLYCIHMTIRQMSCYVTLQSSNYGIFVNKHVFVTCHLFSGISFLFHSDSLILIIMLIFFIHHIRWCDMSVTWVSHHHILSQTFFVFSSLVTLQFTCSTNSIHQNFLHNGPGEVRMPTALTFTVIFHSNY